ncbi:Nif3-like dinuclear metal center hexameric protein [Singulisphaera acidiphila]|uniref:GTP cyclohydrolase 1 type 2 homolog n=1 Tax=Singulisphaera acidiphila (strain ATCC BAA-1392 / DSM 18658 / VKM B-2454 / MOB10) TaxID=886293 RepID=L0DNJ2_SINAD|nr:Nif3-like dinuclear metal center hexameric protein [Singulisphaera acidiphila]AGA30403.1 dinuclear metal center protein, YbgI/SA1388 family [Singulisphaera acidiphila DSM 18658]
MSTVAEVARWLDEFAPLSLAESWDNVGLLWGDPATEVSRVMTCLTVTPQTAREAIDDGAELIVSHHPVLFRPVKRVRADDRETGMLWDLARAGVSIASPHTAFDNTQGGINDGLAGRLGLLETEPLRPASASPSFKIVVFTPRESCEAVLSAAFAAGAGKVGAYEECAFTSVGQGRFFGTEGSNPVIGQRGQRETVRERRVEFVCPSSHLAVVLGAIRSAHPYEEPGMDVYPLHPGNSGRGAGRVGSLASPTTLSAFAELVGQTLAAPGVQVVGPADRRIERVAIVCGAGDDFIGDAVRCRADVLLTGEARFHRALEAESVGIGLVVAGHHATERPGVEDLATQIAVAFPALTVWPSRKETDPLRTIG